MYKFTNGIITFDEKTKDSFLNVGYRLVEGDKSIERVIPLGNNDLSKAIEKEMLKVINENTSNNGTIEKQSKKFNKISK